MNTGTLEDLAGEVPEIVSLKLKKEELQAKVSLKNVKKQIDILLFVMDVQIKPIVERKNIITIILKLKIIMNIY